MKIFTTYVLEQLLGVKMCLVFDETGGDLEKWFYEDKLSSGLI